MKGFTSNVRVFSAPISSEEHRKLYFSEKHQHKTYVECSEDSYFIDEMKEPAMQISYLSHCFESGENNTEDFDNMGVSSDDTSLAFVEIQTAAFDRSVTAWGSCNPAYHYYHAAVEAANAFHELGKQPLHEMTRLYDSFERDITVDNGDVEAMAAMGDLYYWGAHGVPRDHTQAYNYFNRAAEAGNVNAQSAVAGMLLKGEGTAQDNVTAIEWYEKASEKNHTRALNGLGFVHFHGSGGVLENKTLALELFERAAFNKEDGDSIFNAGYCHAKGLGTSVNISRAMEFYHMAAREFGHFDAIFEMGRILLTGESGVVPRNSERAVEYLKAASDGGQWGRVVREGFDLYSDGEYARAVVAYHEARELGYSVALSNLAFLYDQRLLQLGDETSERRALKYLLLTNTENGDRETLVRIGDYHYYGLAGLRKSPKTALRWYSRASAEGVAVGAFNVGQI
ncbi:uncharacterized protein PITG_06946 [Phytophthora infestans T30-4]|uniref:Sel-1 family protein n=1 Tax=Phytophthora infestans (strain T30-4) TaxID=403677 RepID=D0N6V6_PHYIT|nr:uncharacterized protein PITG_06946 [Phytophthora infestans T30-4]EEY53305.1 conserved hypothetical protein [Phytophthora infestans T30-4]|eukprot:XP_002904923.1 conserved hypothetical protein [Phytophthora infestans T30-4]